jgi:hypothetical protein
MLAGFATYIKFIIMIPMRLIPVLCFLAISMMNSCYYDSEEDLYPQGDCNTSNVSFSNDIQPILVNSCLSCHSAAANLGNVNLEGHAAVLKYALNGSLVGSVRHSNPYSPMPQGAAKLEDCKISKMDAWVKAGAPNN